MQRLLLVRLREIGDVVFTTPAVRAVRRRYPDSYIAYLVEPHAAPIVRHNPHINEVIVAPRGAGVGGLVRDIALGRALRSHHFDLALDFHGGPRASLLTWLSAAPERIGYDIPARSWMYTRVVHRARELRPRHSVENQWDLLSAIGIAPPDPAANPVEMPIDLEAAGVARARLQSAGTANGLIVVHVSAGNPFRRWPVDHFIALITRLAVESSRAIIVTSGPSELDAADRVVAGVRANVSAAASARVVACDLSLDELRAVVETASLFVGGDSGPLHVASTSRVPIVALFGPTLPERSSPWRDRAIPYVSLDGGPLPCRPCDQRTCAPGDFRCLTRIEPDRVAEAALRLLSRV